MKPKLLIFAILISIFLTACSSSESPPAAGDFIGQKVSVQGGTYTDISVSELQTMLGNKDFTFVNVHIPFEGDLPDTDLSIPYDEIDQNLDKLPSDKDSKIVLYCRSGNMSSTAADTLVDLGYTNVWNLDGGFNAWEQAGLPMEGQ